MTFLSAMLKEETAAQLYNRLTKLSCNLLLKSVLPILEAPLLPGEILELCFDENGFNQCIMSNILAEILLDEYADERELESGVFAKSGLNETTSLSRLKCAIYLDCGLDFSVFLLSCRLEKRLMGFRSIASSGSSEAINSSAIEEDMQCRILDMLDRFYYVKCRSCDEFTEKLREIENFNICSSKQCVLIVDSVSMLYWADDLSSAKDHKTVFSKAVLCLKSFIAKYNLIAIVSRFAPKKPSEQQQPIIKSLSEMYYSMMPCDWCDTVKYSVLLSDGYCNGGGCMSLAASKNVNFENCVRYKFVDDEIVFLPSHVVYS